MTLSSGFNHMGQGVRQHCTCGVGALKRCPDASCLVPRSKYACALRARLVNSLHRVHLQYLSQSVVELAFLF